MPPAGYSKGARARTRRPLAYPRALPDGPQDVRGHDGPREGRPIAEDDDDGGQVLDLEAIVERVAEAMGPVEEGQGDEDEEVEPRQGVEDQAVEGLVARAAEPPEREDDPDQQQVDREEERG